MSESTKKKRAPTLRLGLASALLLWLAQPPFGLWGLAYVAPIGWLWIIRRESPLDRGDWLRVYASGVVYWLLAVHWVRLPHPLTPIGWGFLAAYLGCYPLMFVWLTHLGVKWMPLWLAAPIVWTGLELLQAHLFTGFLMGALSHTQADSPLLRPLAFFVGAYGVSFVVMLVATMLLTLSTQKVSIGNRLGIIVVVLFLLGDTLAVLTPTFQAAQHAKNANAPKLTVALIQGDTRATWDPDPDRSRKIMDRQVALSLQAVEQAKAEGKTLDLIVWPESMFRAPLETFEGSPVPPADAHENLVKSSEHTQEWFRSLAARLETPLLVGIDHYDWRPDPEDPEGLPKADSYNSAALVDAEGKLVAVYDKTHRVPFGEYIPFASGMPALYFLTPMSGGLASGTGPVAMKLTTADGESIILAPSICYETVVPHVIRRHVAELTDRGEAPDLLVNVTNDAWFWGSSELDMHLACAIYRAVETGTPLIVAANGGLSAVIDASGRVIAQSPRMEEYVLIADVPLRRRGEATPYVRHGDWFAGGCLIVCVGLAILEGYRGFVGRSTADGKKEAGQD